MYSKTAERLTEQKNNRNKFQIVLVVILTALFLIAGIAYLGANYFGYFNKSEPATALPPSQEDLLPAKKINIMVLGIDKRRHDEGRSNVTSVFTIDTGTKEVSGLWIPRDSRVKIPGYGWDKIGHAYAFDGPVLSKKTIEEFFGIPINYYIAIDMAGFSKVVDAVGGVDINVEKRLYYYDPYDEGEVANNHGLIDLQPGLQHMDGNAALQYVRFRNDEMGDIGRIERQRKFLSAFLTQIASPAVITKIPSVIREVNTAFQTDLTVKEMLSLGSIVNDAYKLGVKTDMVSGEPVYIEGISYWLPDIAAMRGQVAEIQGITPDETYLEKARKLSDEYQDSLPEDVEIAE